VLERGRLELRAGLGLRPFGGGGRAALDVPDWADLDAPSRTKGWRLFWFQRDGVEWLRARRGSALLCDEMGIGKSCQVLRAARSLARLIVLCPAGLRHNWLLEIEEWRPDLRARLVSGEQIRAQPRRLVPGPGEVVIVSHDSLPDVGAFDVALGDCEAIVDEAHALKDPSAERTQAARKLLRRVGRVLLLTGTPVLGHPGELETLLDLAGLLRAFGGRRGFRDAFGAVLDAAGNVVDWTGPTGPEAIARLGRIMLRRRRADVLPKLAGKRIVEVRLEAPASLADYLDTQAARWREWSARHGNDPDALPPQHMLSSARAALARAKIPAAVEWVRSALEQSDEALLVFSAHVDPIVEIATLPGCVAMLDSHTRGERQDLVRRFQAGEFRALCGTIALMGTGYTLTRASRELFVDRTWSPYLNDQAEDRAARIGQAALAVDVYRLLTDHPIERRLEEVTERKRALSRATLGDPT
jgi:SNF2 family DNA or RNA helicase